VSDSQSAGCAVNSALEDLKELVKFVDYVVLDKNRHLVHRVKSAWCISVKFSSLPNFSEVIYFWC